jgi:hypothetical protein
MVLMAFATAVFAGETAEKVNPYLAPLSQIKAPELPAECASLVSKAGKEQRESVTVDVISAGARVNSSALSAIVGAVAKAQPDMAALAAATAVGQQPKQTSQIVRAAVGAAPEKAGAIVYAVCMRNPGSYRSVAAIAAELAPREGKAILDSVAAALPGQRAYIAQAQAGRSTDRSVVAVLNEASQLSAQAGSPSGTLASASPTTLRGPTLGPPFQPLSGTPGSTDPSSTTNIPPGGRDYSAP